MVAVALLSAFSAYVALRGIETGTLFLIEDDPVQIAGRVLGQNFNADIGTREIEKGFLDIGKVFGVRTLMIRARHWLAPWYHR